MQPVVCAQGVVKSFGSKQVLRGIDLTLHAGQSVVVLGGSGTGKSVLAKCIMGLLPADAGTISVCNYAMPHQRAQALQHIGMSFQGGALFDSMSVLQNVAFGLIEGRGMTRAKAYAIAEQQIAAVGLAPNTRHLYPAELSGGMQKRAALARAIAHEPQLLIFDEPTAGLDPVMSGVINRLIRDTVRASGAAAITITHDLGTLRTVADWALMLKDGLVV
jgi:phospholipid/cholesterol/gamma-HCH transport system ATP-binding protein